MTAYYNEFDPYSAQWLRNLIDAGLIAPGHVDDRSIVDVTASDLAGYTQCHFFAGIGVWSHALHLNRWPDNLEVWTGSCPCQPFSNAGKMKGFEDERHLWPIWKKLIKKRKPSIVFGEQVASKDAAPWLDLVSVDMETMGLAFGACAFPSAGIGAPHIRDRTYFVAHANNPRLERWVRMQERAAKLAARSRGVAHTLANANSQRTKHAQQISRNSGSKAGSVSGRHDAISQDRQARENNGFWKNADWLQCRDGKWRAVEPGSFPLANGSASRVGQLRAYGNAVNAYAAAAFIKASVGAIADTL